MRAASVQVVKDQAVRGQGWQVVIINRWCHSNFHDDPRHSSGSRPLLYD